MSRLASKFPRTRFVIVLGGLLLILVLTPALENVVKPGLSRMLELLGLVVPVMAASAAGGTARSRGIAFGLAGLGVLATADSLAHLSGLPPQLGIVLCVLLLGYTTVRLFIGVVRSRTVTADVIAGALASYMMIGLTWAFAYGLLETMRPGSIRGLSEGVAPLQFPALLYFSYITLLSIGFGDITPVSSTARILTVFEGLLGMAFTTIILAVLVAAYLNARHNTEV
jgi:hypothetical protein